jgi:hypothetical protein
MLRVTISERAAEQTFLLEGELAGPSVAEMEIAWKSRRSARNQRKCAVDFDGVTFIDEIGESLLLQMWREGADFVGGGVSIREQLQGLGTVVAKRPNEMRRVARGHGLGNPCQGQKQEECCTNGPA